MKAWVIKCKKGGYHHGYGTNIWPMPITNIYRTQKVALVSEEGCVDDEIIPVEIKEITGTRRRKVK